MICMYIYYVACTLSMYSIYLYIYTYMHIYICLYIVFMNIYMYILYIYCMYILYVYMCILHIVYCIYIYIYILTKMCDLKYMNKKNIWIICGYMDKIIHILRGTLGPKRLSNRNWKSNLVIKMFTKKLTLMTSWYKTLQIPVTSFLRALKMEFLCQIKNWSILVYIKKTCNVEKLYFLPNS